MRGLTVILAEPSPARFRAALELVAAQAALGGRARLFLQGPAVTLLDRPERLAEEARALGATLHACQTGLADARIDLSDRPHVAASGPLDLLRTLGDDRLLAL